MNALEERAGVVAALVDGIQTVLMRRPDLPPTRTSERFALYPAYTHQYPERYSPRYEHYYHRSREKIELVDDVGLEDADATPVLDDAAFAERRAAIEAVLS